MLSLPLACMLLLGCEKSVSYSGRWRGNHNLPGSQTDPRLYTLGQVDLTITEGGKFDLVEGGVNRTGTVSYGSGQASLISERIMGKPIEAQGQDAEKLNPPISIEFKDKGEQVSFQDPAAFEPIRKPILLTRVKAQP